jgi:hypothetical protein
MNNSQAVAVSAALLALCGCHAGRTIVEQGPDTHRNYAAVALQPEPATVDVPGPLRGLLDDELKDRIYDGDAFRPGSDLTLRYKIVQFEDGNRFGRAVLPGAAGQGSISVDVTYVDASGSIVGHIVSTGEVSSGTLGGSINNAVENAADQIAKNTIKLFK